MYLFKCGKSFHLCDPRGTVSINKDKQQKKVKLPSFNCVSSYAHLFRRLCEASFTVKRFFVYCEISHFNNSTSVSLFEVGFCSNLILALMNVSWGHCCCSVQLMACQNKQLSCLSSSAESEREIS